MADERIIIADKDTDAVESFRGYNYQVLYTLDTWLMESVSSPSTKFYCEFKDDVYEFNHEKDYSKFQQIKLYKSNFTFKSNEIKKAILNFFRLYSNRESAEVRFKFHTNTNIGREYNDNNAYALQAWSHGWGSLGSDKKVQVVNIVKNVVKDYYKGDREELAYIEDLSDEYWKKFASSIEWEFNNIAPEKAVEILIEKIKSKISQLPFISSDRDIDIAFYAFHSHVVAASTSTTIDDRLLSYPDLQNLILKLSGEDGYGYSKSLSYWKGRDVTVIYHSEFSAIIDSIRFYRRNISLTSDAEVWIRILQQYLSLSDGPLSNYWRVSAYEITWLSLKPDLDQRAFNQTHPIDLEMLDKFFESASVDLSQNQLEDSVNLLNLIHPIIKLGEPQVVGRIDIDFYQNQLYEIVSSKFNSCQGISQKCDFKELLGSLSIVSEAQNLTEANVNRPISHFSYIIENRNDAPFYNYTQFSSRVDRYIEMFSGLNGNFATKLVDYFVDISELLDEIVGLRHGNYRLAIQQVNRGLVLIRGGEGMVYKSLRNFGKAMVHAASVEALELLVVILIKIANIYRILQLTFASRYYSLASLFIIFNSENESLYKRISDGYLMMFFSSMQQGRWLFAIHEFELFIQSYSEFTFELDDNSSKPHIELAYGEFIILMNCLRVSDRNSYDRILESIRSNYSILYDSLGLEDRNAITDYVELRSLLIDKVTDYPFNDFGDTQVSKFEACGLVLTVSWKSTNLHNIYAEKFISVIQIVLAEFGLSKYDAHFIKCDVKIEIVEHESDKHVRFMPSNEEIVAKVSPLYSDESNIKTHNEPLAAALVILSRASLLQDMEFNEIYTELFKEKDLASKILVGNTYETVYEKSVRPVSDVVHNYNILVPDEIHVRTTSNRFIPWDSQLSFKYDRKQCIKNIEARFRNSMLTSSITISRLLGSQRFITVVHNLRDGGYKDWMIASAIAQFMVNAKAHMLIRESSISEEEYVYKLREISFKLFSKPENHYAVYFPDEAFESEEFLNYVQRWGIFLIPTHGLSCKLDTPVVKSINEFFGIKFNMYSDNFDANNYLRMIR